MIMIQVQVGKNFIDDVLIDGGFGVNIITTTIVAWAHDQGKGMERCKSKLQPRSHTHTPRIVKECEGMSPHTPKWTPTLGIEVLMDSQIFRKRFEWSKLIRLKGY
jgi:hypothetical protein